MELNQFSLAGKIALITGGGTGIGFGISKAMTSAGAIVVITGRRKDVLIKAVQNLGKGVYYIDHDNTDKASIPNLVSFVESSVGPIDILVNNAGIHLEK